MVKWSCKLGMNQPGQEVSKMEWTFVVALVVAIPIVLLPPALVWYMNIGGLSAVLREARARRAARRQTIEAKQ